MNNPLQRNAPRHKRLGSEGAESHGAGDAQVFVILRFAAEEARPRSVCRDDVGGEDLHLHQADVGRVAAPGTVAGQDAVGVDDGQIGFTDKQKVGDALGQAARMVEVAVPDRAHEVLDAAGKAGAAVVLEDPAG